MFLIILYFLFLTSDAKITTDDHENIYCKAGFYFSVDAARCILCPAGTFAPNKTMIGCKGCVYKPKFEKCQRCPYNSFAAKEGSIECTKCGSGFHANDNRDSCDYSRCEFAISGSTYNLLPLRNYSGSMYKVKGQPNNASMFYYVNICSLEHDSSSCTTLRSIQDIADNLTVREEVRNYLFSCLYRVSGKKRLKTNNT